MGIWSWSILQFTMVFTATRKDPRKDATATTTTSTTTGASLRSGPASAAAAATATSAAAEPGSPQPPPLPPPPVAKQDEGCCTPDVFGIIMSIFMQDGPFLVLRLLLIIKYEVFSYANTFFTCKNTLVIMLLIYRLIVIQIERYQSLHEPSEADLAAAAAKTASKQRIVLTSNVTTDQYYNYSTKIVLREPVDDPAGELAVTYVIKRHVSLQTSDGADGDSTADVRTLSDLVGACAPSTSGAGEYQLQRKTRRAALIPADAILDDDGGGSVNGALDVNDTEDEEGSSFVIDMAQVEYADRKFAAETDSENSVDVSLDPKKSPRPAPPPPPTPQRKEAVAKTAKEPSEERQLLLQPQQEEQQELDQPHQELTVVVHPPPPPPPPPQRQQQNSPQQPPQQQQQQPQQPQQLQLPQQPLQKQEQLKNSMMRNRSNALTCNSLFLDDEQQQQHCGNNVTPTNNNHVISNNHGVIIMINEQVQPH